MSIFDYFKKDDVKATQTEIKLDSICFDETFCNLSVMNLYSKIMHECADRAALPEDVSNDAYTGTVYDSYSPAKKGLVHIIVHAMANQKQVYYRKIKLSDGSYVFEKSNQHEAMNGTDIKPEYIELDFTSFYEAKILCLLYSLLGGVTQALSNGVSVSQAMLVKIHQLSEMVENSQNMEPLTRQLEQLNAALGGGGMGYVDAQSDVQSVTFDSSPSKVASEYIYGMISGITGVPASYLFSDVVGGLGDMSNSEERRLNVAMKRYFNSIMRGCLYSVFDRKFEYKMLVVDVDAMISLFAWIETTDLITDDAKKKVMINNTVFTKVDMK